jgi:hypothetical protein
MNRSERLQRLTIGDLVAVYIGSNVKGHEVVTAANDKWVTVGKYGKAKRYSRKDGIICGHRPMKHLFRIEP